MADKFLSFTYRGRSLKTQYNGHIVNDGSDLRLFNAPAFSDEFAFPKFGETSHHLGTSKENREFSFTIMFVERTLSQYREILEWLNIDSQGDFLFDYSPNYFYNVKLISLSPGIMHISPNCDPNTGQQNLLYNVEIQVSFITIGDWAAKWSATEPFLSSDNSPLFEGFETHNILSGGYSTGDFIGAKIEQAFDIEWDYEFCRSEENFPITNKGVMLAFADEHTSSSKLESSPIPRGIKSFSVDIRKAFTNNRERNLTINIYSNSTLVETFTTGFLNFASGLDNTIITFEQTLNTPIQGNFSFEFIISGTYTFPGDPRQIVIDNLSWVSAEGISFSDLVDNEKGESFVEEFDISTGELILNNAHNLENFYEITFSGGIKVLDSNQVLLYEVEDGFSGTIFTRYGISLDGEGRFIPMKKNIGVFSVSPNSQVGIVIKDYESFSIKSTSREYL